MNDYRAYFEKQKNCTYEEHIQNEQRAKDSAISSQVSRLIQLEKESKDKLLKRLQD